MCTKFQSSRPHSSWEKCDEKCLCLKIGEKEKRKKWTNKSSSMILVYMIHPPIFQVCSKFQPSRPYSSGEKCDEKYSCLKIGEKEKWKIKGWICSSSLISVYRIHLPTVHECMKFQPSRPHSSGESVTKKFNVWKLERKKNEEIKRRICSSSLIPVYTIHLQIVHVCNKF